MASVENLRAQAARYRRLAQSAATPTAAASYLRHASRSWPRKEKVAVPSTMGERLPGSRIWPGLGA